MFIQQIVIAGVVGIICITRLSGSVAEANSNTSPEITESLVQILKRDHGSIDILKRQHVLQLPQAVPLQSNNANLPEQPDAGFGYYLSAMTPDPGQPNTLNLVWMPSVGVGGVYTDEGSGDCDTWIMFTADKTATHSIPTPTIFTPSTCILDGGQSYIGIFRHRAVAFKTQINGDETSGYTMQVAAQIWDGTDWTSPQALGFPLLISHAAKP